MNPTEAEPVRGRRELFAAATKIVFAYGRTRLFVTLGLILSQAVAQVTGVASIFWFISVAVAPDRIRDNSAIAWVLRALQADQVSTSTLTLVCGLLSLGVLVISNLLSLAGEYARARYAHGLGCWLRDVLLRRILSNRFQYFLAANSSVLVKKVVQDVMQFIQQMVLPSLEIVTRALIFLMLSCWLIAHEPIVAIGGLAFFALFEMLFIRAIRTRASIISSGIKSCTRDTYSSVGQIFNGIKPVLTENSREHFARQHHEPSSQLARIVPQATLVSSLAKYALETVVYGGLVTWMLLELLSGNSIQQLMPSVGLFAVAAYRMLPCIQITASQLTTIQSTTFSLQEILDEFQWQVDCSQTSFDEDANAAALPFSESIRFEDVFFRYEDTDRPAIDGISMTILKGAHIGIVGPTGSGKSTLINLLLGLFTPSSGTIWVDHERLSDANVAKWRAAIGYVPQDPFLIDATIAENVAFGVRPEEIDYGRVESVLQIAQADTFIRDECRNGVHSVIGERGVRLSGGQKQRIAIARALYKQPALLILDEATSALDNVTERRLTDGLRSLESDMTVISIAHRLSTIEDCGCIYYLADGHFSSSGSYGELIERSSKFKQLVDAG